MVGDVGSDRSHAFAVKLPDLANPRGGMRRVIAGKADYSRNG